MHLSDERVKRHPGGYAVRAMAQVSPDRVSRRSIEVSVQKGLQGSTTVPEGRRSRKCPCGRFRDSKPGKDFVVITGCARRESDGVPRIDISPGRPR
ncbi:hypothetical protein AORI_6221 [Amycolatopsis keratiniphila]|uniref:Uncharacterized protein n=1 Tax=Amycolatopsis keratiniphila TaxID=129921 RepID=R4SZM5_9PSEU|nr:hypothetical protein AORI_6221 [Amycolatopsis keratiniphila]